MKLIKAEQTDAEGLEIIRFVINISRSPAAV